MLANEDAWADSALWGCGKVKIIEIRAQEVKVHSKVATFLWKRAVVDPNRRYPAAAQCIWRRVWSERVIKIIQVLSMKPKLNPWEIQRLGRQLFDLHSDATEDWVQQELDRLSPIRQVWVFWLQKRSFSHKPSPLEIRWGWVRREWRRWRGCHLIRRLLSQPVRELLILRFSCQPSTDSCRFSNALKNNSKRLKEQSKSKQEKIENGHA